MPVAVRKAKPASSSSGTPAVTRKTIAAALRDHMAAHYDMAIAEMFAEIDRNLDASEQCTARLLAAQR
jgi:hypothetical protein